MTLRILFVGDIVGKPGRDLLRRGLRALVDHHGVDFVVANVENCAGGFGVTRETGDEILEAGVDVMTSGNHIWDKKEALGYVAGQPRLLRPLNYAEGAPGRGAGVFTSRGGHDVAVVNAMGRVHMPLVNDPFGAVSLLLPGLREQTPVILIDFHAEVTSEKLAFGWHVAGRATAVVGTHTHVQTADNRVLPGGTAYITDVGMSGPHDSVIGVEKEAALARFLTGLPSRFDTASGDPRLHGVLIDADPATGHATGITRLSITRDEMLALREAAGGSG